MDGEGQSCVLQPRDKTYVYLWTYRQFQQEQAEWDGVNNLLQNHGFKPVHFADPVENKNLSDLVLLDKKAAWEVRASLRTMLADSDRREALIQELLHSNALHKDKSQELLGQAAHHSQRAAELEGLLGGLKAKVQDLEDRFLANAAQHHQVQEDARSRCASLELKLSQESEAAEQLQKKLCFAVREEETRVARQTRTFQQIHQRSARPDSPVDLQVLDVIDFYESQMAEMRDEMRSLKENLEASGENALPLSGKRASNNTALPLKGALKSYREQLNKSKAQEEELKSKVQKLKQELEMRPTVKELKTYKHQLRRMDRIKQNTSRSPGGGERTEMTSRDAGKCSQQVPETVLSSQYRRLLNEMGSLLMAPWAPVPLRRQKPGPDASEPVEFCELLPALETWNKQLGMLKDLHGALSKLTQRLIPWQPSHSTRGPGEPVRVDELMLMVDTLLEETSIEDEKVLRSPTRHTLESMVSHFQKLFDVRSLRGVYPRMNEVYTKLGEMANAMRNLRDILGLDDRAVPSAVVNRVAHVASSSTGEASRLQYHNLLAEGDIDSIIVKVKEHNEFFPAFHALATDLMQTLGVNRLDDILPALRSVTRWTH